MEQTSVGLCFDLINSTATLAFNVSQIIAELKNAGHEFEDVVGQLTLTNTSLLHLKYLFEITSLPPYLVPELTRQVQGYQGSLEDIEASLNQVIRSLNNRPFLRRHLQERAMADGDLWRLSNKVLSLNQNLNLTLSTYSCAVVSIVHDGVSRKGLGVGRAESSVGGAELGISRVESSTGRAELGVDMVDSNLRGRESEVQDVRADIAYQYIEAEKRPQQDWDKICVDDSFCEESMVIPPSHGGIQSTASMDGSVGTRGWNISRFKPKLPPRHPPTATRTQEKDAWYEPVSGINSGMNEYFPGQKPLPKLPARRQVEGTLQMSTPSLGKRVSGFFTGKRPQPTTSLNPWKAKEEDFRTVEFKSGYGLGSRSVDLSGAQRVQDEEWRVWEQKRRDASLIYEM